MTVLLRHSADLPATGEYERWAAMLGATTKLARTSRIPNLGPALEEAFDASAGAWLALGRILGAEPTSDLAHTPTCAANISDFGLVLAWSRLIERWAGETGTVLVVCNDPWVFRHLAQFPNVETGTKPCLWRLRVALACRGFAARVAVALRMLKAALVSRSQARSFAGRLGGDTWFLVYGHPASNADGNDGYFGDLMRRMPKILRLLHADCPHDTARRLNADARTVNIHGWGHPLFALRLPFVRWRPSRTNLDGESKWLVKRAATLEGGTGQPAMISWQIHCQNAWLDDVKPQIVAWPWENHAWERAFVRAARRCGVTTIGYQHTVIGRQEINHASRSNADGLDSVPDWILCTGPGNRDLLACWGIPQDRLEIGGALRSFTNLETIRGRVCAPDGPVFVALPSDGALAQEMVAAINTASRDGHRFVVKDHPMMPCRFAESDTVKRTLKPLHEQDDGVSAVVFSATTVGLEAALMGIPTIRYQPNDRIALDVFPAGVKIPTTNAENLAAVLSDPPNPVIVPDNVFAPIDHALWKRLLEVA